MSFTVLDEQATLGEILAGHRSLARFGDGEISIAACDRGSRGQEYAPDLGARLREVAGCTDPRLLVAIPRIFETIPKHMQNSWGRWTRPERARLWVDGRVYGSAFISRPDFYGKPFGADYWALMRWIWQDRDVLLVRGDEHRPELFNNAAGVSVLMGLPRDAWKEYPELLKACLLWAKEMPGSLLILMLGPTATVLAHDLALQGVQAIDLGKAPRFYQRELGEAA